MYDALAETKLEEQHYDFYAAEARDRELNRTRQKERLDMKKTEMQIHQDRRRAEKERELADELKVRDEGRELRAGPDFIGLRPKEPNLFEAPKKINSGVFPEGEW